MQQWLLALGYQVMLATGFQHAREQLEQDPPDLLVADVKLEAYNGLHLAIWANGRRLATRTLLVGDADLVLQKEAERERAFYLTGPVDEAMFVAATHAIFDLEPPARRTPRKRVEVDAVIDGVLASVVDVSYGGLCLAVRDADAIAFPPFFTLRLPAFDVSCRLQRVWTSRTAGQHQTLLCGARLPGGDGQTASHWRTLVDTIPERSPLPLESAETAR